jgi:hypothetical protein
VNVVCFRLGNSPASEFCMQTFRNTLFHLHRQVGMKNSPHSSCLLAYEDGTECSETSAYKIQTPGNYPEENIQHLQHGKRLKSRIIYIYIFKCSTGELVRAGSRECLTQQFCIKTPTYFELSLHHFQVDFYTNDAHTKP